MHEEFYEILPTNLGWVGVLATRKGIRRLTLPQPSPQQAAEGLSPTTESAAFDPARFEELQERLERLFSGDPVSFGETLDLEDSPPFFRRAWQTCRTIPRGDTRSYAWLAAQAGSPRAVRAAGQAMARNPVSIIIPCHRVIASDGALCGYGGGLELKRRLLELERATPL